MVVVMLSGDISVGGLGGWWVVIWVRPNAVRYACKYAFLWVHISVLGSAR